MNVWDGVNNHKQTRKQCVGHRPVWASQRHPLLVFIVELLRSSGSDSRRITHFSMSISRIWNMPIDKRYYVPQATKWNKRVHLGSRHQKAIYSGDPIFPHVLWYITWFYILLLYNEYLRQSSPTPRGARVAGMCLQKHAHAHADTHVHAQVRAHAINSYPLFTRGIQLPCNILLWSCLPWHYRAVVNL